ncbi:uncharacterized protein LOC107267231 [Cephus cinctus]|uniref:Uncharacterized protein LOC107267231 n=1 Tax=Cephus cinctus TaxID=211228 RepID=A0AAJ7FIZ9_CEPCN|nr:uncharacterized protein LOC107267231 [Cephus cinctus]
MQSLKNLEERLLREENRLSATDDNPGAFAATREWKKKKYKNKIKCYRCQVSGHFARECKSRNPKSDRENSDNRECAFVVDCDIRPTHPSVGKNGSSKIPTEVANAILSADKSEAWLTDSEASRHITFRREWLENCHELPNGGTVTLVDGKECHVVGEGTVNIKKYVRSGWKSSTIAHVLYVPKMLNNESDDPVLPKQELVAAVPRDDEPGEESEDNEVFM